MLKDVLFITKNIFDNTLSESNSFVNCDIFYEVYKKLKLLLENINLIIKRITTLKYIDEDVNNNSYKSQLDKWILIFNKDLENLDKSIKEFLFSIYYLNPIIIHNHFKAIAFYTFLKFEYKIEPISSERYELNIIRLRNSINTDEQLSLKEHIIRDLSSFKNILQLKQELNDANMSLQEELKRLKYYIYNRFSLKDLLN